VTVVEVTASALLLTGSVLCLLAGAGLQRFDSVFARMHAATKSMTLGLALVASGAALTVDDPGDRVKLLLVAALQFITAPVAAHVVGRAAYRSGTELQADMALDELAGQDLDDDPRP